MTTASLPRPPQPMWRITRHVVSWLWLACAALAAGAMGAVTFFAAARVTSHIWLMILAALALCLTLATGLAWPGWRGLGIRLALRAALATGAATTLALALLAALTIFKPLAAPQVLPPLPDGAAYWDLPTGSRIAYQRVPAVGAPRPTPFIMLHGGPGAFGVTSIGAAYYGSLAGNGFDVYLYDQAGSGHSARLPDPLQYTVDRHVADLEAIRQQIGAEQVVLIGDSWGAILAANYMTVHPERVARVIFTSPGPMSRADTPKGGVTPAARLSPDRQQQSQALLNAPRLVAWRLLMEINFEAATHFIPEAELDGFADRLMASFIDGAVYDVANLARGPDFIGFGWWSMTMTNVDMNLRARDPHLFLPRNRTPALVLRGEYDYIPARVAEAYRTSLPNASLVNVPNAGHLLYDEQPELFLAIVRAFLLDQPLPLPAQ